MTWARHDTRSCHWNRWRETRSNEPTCGALGPAKRFLLHCIVVFFIPFYLWICPNKSEWADAMLPRTSKGQHQSREQIAPASVLGQLRQVNTTRLLIWCGPTDKVRVIIQMNKKLTVRLALWRCWSSLPHRMKMRHFSSLSRKSSGE